MEDKLYLFWGYTRQEYSDLLLKTQALLVTFEKSQFGDLYDEFHQDAKLAWDITDNDIQVIYDLLSNWFNT